jgi:hypothetical protein
VVGGRGCLLPPLVGVCSDKPTARQVAVTTTDLALNVPSSSPLARLETARRLLAEVRSVDEVKAIHDAPKPHGSMRARRDWDWKHRTTPRKSTSAPNASLVNCWAPSTRTRRQFQAVAACDRFEQGRQVAGSGCLKEPVFALAGDCRRTRTGSSPLLEFQTDPLLVLPLSIGMSPAYASRVAATARLS